MAFDGLSLCAAENVTQSSTSTDKTKKNSTEEHVCLGLRGGSGRSNLRKHKTYGEAVSFLHGTAFLHSAGLFLAEVEYLKDTEHLAVAYVHTSSAQ